MTPRRRSAAADSDKTESQRIRETIPAQLPEGQFTESLVAQLMEKGDEGEAVPGAGGDAAGI